MGQRLHFKAHIRSPEGGFFPTGGEQHFADWFESDASAQLVWLLCHEFGYSPAQVMKLGMGEIQLLRAGLKWWFRKK